VTRVEGPGSSGPPMISPTERRAYGFFLGYGLVGAAVGWAILGGAGVRPSPSSFDSGPATSSLDLLYVAVGLLVVGAAIVARYGSIYANVPGPEERAAGRARAFSGQAATGLVIVGVGLLLIGLLLPWLPWCISYAMTPCFISPSVTYVPHTLDWVGVGCFALGLAAFGARGLNRRAEFRAWWRRTGRYVTVAGVSVVVVVTAMMTVPIHQSFSQQLTIPRGESAAGSWIFPTGVRVTGTWSATPGGTVDFSIQSPTGATVYATNASGGTFSFVTVGNPWGLYGFYGNSSSHEVVNVTGSYSAPSWAWPPGEPVATQTTG
jgi:hypothetical protein